MSKNEILSAIRASINQNKSITPREDAFYENHMKFANEDILAEYVLNQTNNKAIVIESSKAGLSNKIEEILKALDSQEVLCADKEIARSITNHKVLDYDRCVDEMRDKLFEVDSSIISAACGVANIGVVGLFSSPLTPRLSSLVVKNAIFLLKKEDVVISMKDAIEKMKMQNALQNPRLPANMIFVAGPSRTADIELITVFGVHGPQVTYVILY